MVYCSTLIKRAPQITVKYHSKATAKQTKFKPSVHTSYNTNANAWKFSMPHAAAVHMLPSVHPLARASCIRSGQGWMLLTIVTGSEKMTLIPQPWKIFDKEWKV